MTKDDLGQVVVLSVICGLPLFLVGLVAFFVFRSPGMPSQTKVVPNPNRAAFHHWETQRICGDCGGRGTVAAQDRLYFHQSGAVGFEWATYRCGRCNGTGRAPGR
jgi:hypothetical protein